MDSLKKTPTVMLVFPLSKTANMKYNAHIKKLKIHMLKYWHQDG